MAFSVFDSPFYRVTSRAIILNSDNKLLLVEDDEFGIQVPGGGWEHDETLALCVTREMDEELGVGVKDIGPILFTYRKAGSHGFTHLRLCMRVVPDSFDFKLGDGMKKYHFVSKEELLVTELCLTDQPIKDHADAIWSQS